jgi:hypothetical protein
VLGDTGIEVARQKAYDNLFVLVVPEEINPEVSAWVSGGTLFEVPFEKFATTPVSHEILVALFPCVRSGN